MKTTTILCAALLLVVFGCKQPENVNTTSSSETTSTVTETTTTAATTAPVTNTSATGAMATATTATVSTAAPVPTATTATTASSSKSTKVAEKPEGAKKVSGPTVTESGSTTGATGLPKNPPSPPKSAPPANETMGTNPAASKSSAPATSSNASLVSTGQSIFKSQCVACHGSDASGNTPIGKKNNIPDYRSAAVQGQSDAELAKVIANGKGPISASAHKSKHLSSDQINAVVAYIRSLK